MPAEVVTLIWVSLVLLGVALLALVLVYRVERQRWNGALVSGKGSSHVETLGASAAARVADRAAFPPRSVTHRAM